MTWFEFHNFTCLNLKNYQWDNSVNTLMTQKCIQFNQKYFSTLRNETLKLKHVFSNTYIGKIEIYHV